PLHPPHSHSFPTRRSSDLRHAVDLGYVVENARHLLGEQGQRLRVHVELREPRDLQDLVMRDAHALSHSRSSPAYATSSCFMPISDRKSTRLNSSHVAISYA